MAHSHIDLPPGTPASFLMFVDTEEEFDWSKNLESKNRSVAALPHLKLAHDIFAKHGVVPHYLVDYPVANAVTARDLFRSLAAEHPLEIGAHLHPWVTPPYEEQISAFNSFPGNLPSELERAKLLTLTNAIRDGFNCSPIVYKAGRYGIGPNTPSILTSLGFQIDVSVRSRFDYSKSHGPNFAHIASHPYWLNDEKTLLEIPSSSAFSGLLAPVGSYLNDESSENGRNSLSNGVLSKLKLLCRLNLTPEGYTIEEAITCIGRLQKLNIKVFTISFHSPSLEIGNTPYVRNEHDKRQLLHWLDEILKYLKDEVGAAPSTAAQTYEFCRGLI